MTSLNVDAFCEHACCRVLESRAPFSMDIVREPYNAILKKMIRKGEGTRDRARTNYYGQSAVLKPFMAQVLLRVTINVGNVNYYGQKCSYKNIYGHTF